MMTCTSADFLRWTEPQWLQYPGSPRMQIYLNQIRPYYRAPHLFVGFPGRLMAGREFEKGLPITKHPSYKMGSISETLFMTSRNGLHFRRWGEAFVRPGPRKERSQTLPDELSLYISDGGGWSSRGKATRFRRYTMRIDGFVSLQAPLSGGEIVTKPLVFTVGQVSNLSETGYKPVLRMDFATSAAGSVWVETQNESGKPAEGFALDDCPEIFGDEIDGVVTSKRASDLSHLAGKPICLRFVLQDTDLYSIQFRP